MQEYNILVVDDEKNVADIVSAFMELHREEFSTHVYTNPKEAKDHPGYIHAVVSDYNMPEMNGVQLLQKMKEENQDFIGIIHSGKSLDDIEKGLENGLDYPFWRKSTDTGTYEEMGEYIESRLEGENETVTTS